MTWHTDQIGRSIAINSTPKRIISIVPSQTELLYDLGLFEAVIGITKFCIHPEEWFRNKLRVGGTKKLDIEKIRSLRPDLILANKEENEKEQVEMLANEFPVWTSDISSLQDALNMIRAVGEIVNKKREAGDIADRIIENFKSIPVPAQNLKTCYLIWKDPYMTIGGDTFIHDMLKHAGFDNMFGNCDRYPVTGIENLQNCQLLLLSSEPYPFKQQHKEELQASLPQAKIMLVDGEMFSWYGSRLLQSPRYFNQLQNDILSLTHAGNR